MDISLRLRRICAISLVFGLSAVTGNLCRGEIYRWDTGELISEARPSEQSRRFDLFEQDLSYADFANYDLTGSNLVRATLTNANFAGARISGVDFSATTMRGFTDTQLYRTASYQEFDLHGIRFNTNDLSGWNLQRQNLQHVDFFATELTSTNFTGADIRYANLRNATTRGFTSSQLYSTSSYRQRNLTGVEFRYNNLTGWDFQGQNLSRANFDDADLRHTNLRGANLARASFLNARLPVLDISQTDATGGAFDSADLTGAKFSASHIRYANLSRTQLLGAQLDHIDAIRASFYEANLDDANLRRADLRQANLRGVTAHGADFSGVNLRDARLDGADLTDAKFNAAWILGTYFSADSGTGLSRDQLELTTSYRSANLAGTSFSYHDFPSVNFASFNLQNSSFLSSNLTDANLEDADLSWANLQWTQLESADLRGADLAEANTHMATFEAADLRGANIFLNPNAIFSNAILPDGTIDGLSLLSGESLVVRGDVRPELISGKSLSDPVTNIQIAQSAVIESGGRLVFALNELDWNSTISFAAGIPVQLDGALELGFQSGIDANNQIGREFQLFDWSNVSPAGTLTLDSKFSWDTSHLYTTGYVTLLAVPEPSLTPLLQLMAAGWMVLRARRRR